MGRLRADPGEKHEPRVAISSSAETQQLDAVAYRSITTGAPATVTNGLRLLTKAAIEKPFAGPEAVLAYLARYTHRVAISNSRLLRFDEAGVTFRYKDYRRDGADRQQVMTLPADEIPWGVNRVRICNLQ